MGGIVRAKFIKIEAKRWRDVEDENDESRYYKCDVCGHEMKEGNFSIR